MAPRKRPGIINRQNADGSWSYDVRWRDGGGRDGKRLTHTFSVQKLAVEAHARIVANGWRCDCPKHAPRNAAAGLGDKGGTILFGKYARAHVDALTGIGPGYRRQYLRDLERHLAPFHDKPLDGIPELDVRKWIRGMETGSHPWLTQPMSPTTVKRLLAQAGAVLAAAQSDGLATRNPFKGHRLARRDRDQHTEMTVLSHEEWTVLQAALPAGVYRDMCTVLIGTGMRWGEVTALAVGAVNPLSTPPTLHVARAWQDDGANGYQLGTPKSVRSRRTITFTGAVLDALIPHLSGKRDDELVFTTSRGTPVRHSNFYNRYWRPALDAANAAGLEKRPRIHDLRHSHVSWLIGAGVDVAAVSRRLGHESITTTVDRYHHILPQVESNALAALEAAMPGRDPQ